MKPEQRSRSTIDELLEQSGWIVQDRRDANITAARGVAIREFPLKPGYGFADYLFYVDGAAAGVIETKKEGATLTGFEDQSFKYSEGLPDTLPTYRRPPPFCYQTTGIETRFTNLLEPDPRSRPVSSFHRPETFAGWLTEESRSPGSTLPGRLKRMPPLDLGDLWPAQIRAIRGLERSLAESRPRALIQMATGSGKTSTACNFSYRLIKHAAARRILFLVDRKTLGQQTLKEFQQFVTPDDGRKFTELYNVQLMQSNKLDPVAKVCITTIQRLYSMLRGEPDLPDPESEEQSLYLKEQLFREPCQSATTPPSPSRPSTSSSPTNVTAPSTTSGVRFSNTLTRPSSASPPHPPSKPSASSTRTSSWSTTTIRPSPTVSTSISTRGVRQRKRLRRKNHLPHRRRPRHRRRWPSHLEEHRPPPRRPPLFLPQQL